MLTNRNKIIHHLRRTRETYGYMISCKASFKALFRDTAEVNQCEISRDILYGWRSTRVILYGCHQQNKVQSGRVGPLCFIMARQAHNVDTPPN